MRAARFLLIAVFGIELLSACSPARATEAPAVPVAQLNPPLSQTTQAAPEAETSLQLEDGAQVIIPANALSGAAQVTLERNPQKPNALPPLPAGDTQLSDFYAVRIEGAELNTMIELILPFDLAAIPDNQDSGMLMAMFPTDTGWEYVPVQTRDNRAIIVTDRVGDPLIAWHFSEIIDWKIKNEPGYLENLKARAICAPTFPLRLIPLEGEHGFTIIGRLQPARFTYLGFIPRTPAAGVPVHLYVNKSRPYKGSDAIEVITDPDGNFEVTLRYSEGDLDLYQSYNWVYAAANCDPWPGEVSVKSEGWASINILPEEQTGAPTQPEAQTPEDNPLLVELPDVVGLTEDDAARRLMDAGVMVLLGDGASPYEIGVVFKQEPAAGTLVDPYQVAALIYVTSEQVADPCKDPALTPEEQANCGNHQYVITRIRAEGSCTDEQKTSSTTESDITFNFYQGGVEMFNSVDTFQFLHIANNTYQMTTQYYDLKVTYYLNMSGLTYTLEHPNGCTTFHSAVIK